MGIEEQIAQALVKAVRESARIEDWAAAVMPLVKQAHAEELRAVADEMRSVFADPDRRRPLHPKAETPTDFVTDEQWAELIVRNRADRIDEEAGE